MSRPDWIAVDWGTSRLRARAMQGRSVIASAKSDQGMGVLAADQFEPCLLDLVGDWLGPETPIIACGMVGARQGWIDAGYTPVPCKPLSDRLRRATTTDPRLKVWVVPGISQAKPTDVMRGEETQIAGFLNLNPGWDGVLCLPGTHSKWAHISAGEIVSFQSAMTGELVEVLSKATVLRHSVAQDGWDKVAFLDALDATRSRPETLATQLFRLRAADLLDGQDAIVARSRLIGALIGAELAATRAYWLGQEVAVIGASGPVQAYATALRAQGLTPIEADGDAMTRAGLCVAFDKVKETA